MLPEIMDTSLGWYLISKLLGLPLLQICLETIPLIKMFRRRHLLSRKARLYLKFSLCPQEQMRGPSPIIPISIHSPAGQPPPVQGIIHLPALSLLLCHSNPIRLWIQSQGHPLIKISGIKSLLPREIRWTFWEKLRLRGDPMVPQGPKVEAIPRGDHQTGTSLMALINSWICRLRKPSQLRSGNSLMFQPTYLSRNRMMSFLRSMTDCLSVRMILSPSTSFLSHLNRTRGPYGFRRIGNGQSGYTC